MIDRDKVNLPALNSADSFWSKPEIHQGHNSQQKLRFARENLTFIDTCFKGNLSH